MVFLFALQTNPGKFPPLCGQRDTNTDDDKCKRRVQTSRCDTIDTGADNRCASYMVCVFLQPTQLNGTVFLRRMGCSPRSLSIDNCAGRAILARSAAFLNLFKRYGLKSNTAIHGNFGVIGMTINSANFHTVTRDCPVRRFCTAAKSRKALTKASFRRLGESCPTSVRHGFT